MKSPTEHDNSSSLEVRFKYSVFFRGFIVGSVPKLSGDIIPGGGRILKNARIVDLHRNACVESISQYTWAVNVNQYVLKQ